MAQAEQARTRTHAHAPAQAHARTQVRRHGTHGTAREEKEKNARAKESLCAPAKRQRKEKERTDKRRASSYGLARAGAYRHFYFSLVLHHGPFRNGESLVSAVECGARAWAWMSATRDGGTDGKGERARAHADRSLPVPFVVGFLARALLSPTPSWLWLSHDPPADKTR